MAQMDGEGAANIPGFRVREAATSVKEPAGLVIVGIKIRCLFESGIQILSQSQMDHCTAGSTRCPHCFSVSRMLPR